jgi:ketosteroid isomerase-like protein
MSDRISELAVTYNQAWASHDPDAIVALHTEDAVFHLHDVMEPWVGREAIRAAAADSPSAMASLHARTHMWIGSPTSSRRASTRPL